MAITVTLLPRGTVLLEQLLPEEMEGTIERSVPRKLDRERTSTAQNTGLLKCVLYLAKIPLRNETGGVLPAGSTLDRTCSGSSSGSGNGGSSSDNGNLAYGTNGAGVPTGSSALHLSFTERDIVADPAGGMVHLRPGDTVRFQIMQDTRNKKKRAVQIVRIKEVCLVSSVVVTLLNVEKVYIILLL